MTENKQEPVQNEDGFVRNADSKSKRKRFTLPHAFYCAGSGFLRAFMTQRNMKVHFVAAVFVLAAGWVLHIDASSWMAIAICIGLVFAFECMNTAVEAVVDLVSPGYHELARWAKDCAAAAVLVAAVISVVVGLLVFVPVLLNW